MRSTNSTTSNAHENPVESYRAFKMDLQRDLANFNILEIGQLPPHGVHTEPGSPRARAISRKQIYHLTVGEVVTSLPVEFALSLLIRPSFSLAHRRATTLYLPRSRENLSQEKLILLLNVLFNCGNINIFTRLKVKRKVERERERERERVGTSRNANGFSSEKLHERATNEGRRYSFFATKRSTFQPISEK